MNHPLSIRIKRGYSYFYLADQIHNQFRDCESLILMIFLTNRIDFNKRYNITNNQKVLGLIANRLKNPKKFGFSKGQLILKCPFGVFKSPKKTNDFFSRISGLDLASKKRSNEKNKGTLYR